jgi:translation elongation factor EF-1alpha
LEKEIGKVLHFFDKIGVAVLKMSDRLKTGDKIRIESAEPFVQIVTSMQVNHKELKEAKKGDDIGLKVEGRCNDGDKVIRLG